MPHSQIKALLTQLKEHLDSSRPAVQMWVFAATGAFLISLFFFLTRPAVERHENQRLLTTLKELMPEKSFSAAALKDAVEIRSSESGLSRVQLYRIHEGERIDALF